MLERAKAALEHPDVGAEAQDDGEREDRELPALLVDVEVEARGHAGGEQGERDEHDVCRDHLAYEGIVAAGHSWSLHGSESAQGGQMGSSPHIGTARR